MIYLYSYEALQKYKPVELAKQSNRSLDYTPNIWPNQREKSNRKEEGGHMSTAHCYCKMTTQIVPLYYEPNTETQQKKTAELVCIFVSSYTMLEFEFFIFVFLHIHKRLLRSTMKQCHEQLSH